MPRSSIVVSDNLFDFFHEQVETAAEHLGRPISEEGVFYLSSLLAERGHRSPEQAREVAETLAEMHLIAQQSPPAEAVRTYRTLGDEALYVSGFFRRSLAHRIVGVDYYLRMGSAAYQRLARLLRAPSGLPELGEGGHKRLDEIFEELALAFDACSEILREVREMVQTEVRGASAVLKLYEEWLETGSRTLEERLRAMGLIVGRRDDAEG